MRKSLIALSLALGLTVGIGTAAFANVRTGDIYGPNAQGPRTDNGSCQNAWANDTFDRSFIVNPTPTLVNGFFTYKITRYDREGHFVTIEGPSPGACNNNGASNGSTVLANVRGRFHGFVNYTVTCTTFKGDCYSPSGGTTYMGGCGTQCFTADFIAAAFPGATYVSGTYKYVYASGNTVLCLSRWTDSGNATSETLTGDIATTCH